MNGQLKTPNCSMVLVTKNKLIEWLSKLAFTNTPQYRNWTWAIIPMYSFEDNGKIFHAVMYYKSDMSAKNLIFFPRPDNRPPTNEEINELIETNYNEEFSFL